MVNLGGISFDHRMTEDSGAAVSDVARAFIASRNVFRFTDHWREIDELGSTISLDTQIDLLLEVRRMSERGTTWLLRHFPPPMHIGTSIETFGGGIDLLAGSLEEHMGGRVAHDIERLRRQRISEGVPADLAARSARWPWLHTGFDMVHLAFSESCDVTSAASTYGAVFEAFDIGWMWDGIGALPRSDRWQTQARSSMRDDLMNVMAELDAQRDAFGARFARQMDRSTRTSRRSHHRDAPGDPASRELRPHHALCCVAPAPQPDDLRRRLTKRPAQEGASEGVAAGEAAVDDHVVAGDP